MLGRTGRLRPASVSTRQEGGERVALPLVGPLLDLLGGAARSSVDNARGAAAALSAAVADRRALMDALDEEGAAAYPGELVRLSPETSFELLAHRSVGRLAYVARAGTPDIVPVNYRLFEGDVLIRSGPGPKLQAAERRDLVAFEVDDLDEDTATGWSVVVVGRLRRLRETERLRLPASVLPEPWASGRRDAVVGLTPVRVTGRRVT
jgi:nitroimidazol reductase NimA-like FMN-containing flavoprotein (pyridoxamine 5'-phosphate oxidase superfamily)